MGNVRVVSVTGEGSGMFVEMLARRDKRVNVRIVSVAGEESGMFVEDVGRERQR